MFCHPRAGKYVSFFLIAFVGLWAVRSLPAGAQTSTTDTVNWNTTYQTIDGFGASDDVVAATAYDSFIFNTLGFTLLRTGTPQDGSCTSISEACASDGSSIADMQAAAAAGAEVWATSWAPPASMETNDSIACEANSGNGTLIPGDYQAFANYLSNYIASLKDYYGINLYAISPQNEPTQCESYGSSLWTPQDLDTFIADYLGPTLAANDQSNVKIMMPETPGWGDFTEYAGPCMSDPSCSQYVGINAFHGYDNSFSISDPYSGPAFWETEVSAGDGYGPNAPGCSDGQWCPGINDAMMWAGIIDYNVAVANESAWNYWSLLDPVGRQRRAN